jgi:hypothetical protein
MTVGLFPGWIFVMVDLFHGRPLPFGISVENFYGRLLGVKTTENGNYDQYTCFIFQPVSFTTFCIYRSFYAQMFSMQ